MVGPLAEKIAEALVRNHPNACRNVREDVRCGLNAVEEVFGRISTSAIADARNFLIQDEEIHGGVTLYAHNGGRVGDSSEFI